MREEAARTGVKFSRALDRLVLDANPGSQISNFKLNEAQRKLEKLIGTDNLKSQISNEDLKSALRDVLGLVIGAKVGL